MLFTFALFLCALFFLFSQFRRNRDVPASEVQLLMAKGKFYFPQHL